MDKGDWTGCKNILCIRPDNMGDLIMSGPAIRALKEKFNAKITVLTSSMAKGIVTLMPEIDDTMIFDAPWIKTETAAGSRQVRRVVQLIREGRFDATVIFTVYSQNPLPAAMLPYLAGVPKILAYCRENPYGLVTDWVPDPEPYNVIKHQVRRDLDLVKTVGAVPSSENLCLYVNSGLTGKAIQKLAGSRGLTHKPWIILHPGVSEIKRRYPVERWIAAGKQLIKELDYQLLITGSASEKMIADQIVNGIGAGSFAVAGLFDIEEFAGLVAASPAIVSVNTGAVHIAAATGTPVVVLYAQTNPQHTPWKVPCRVLQFPVAISVRSKNEVIRYVNDKLYDQLIDMPTPDQIVSAVKELLRPGGQSLPPPRGTLTQNRETGAS